jgi:hypothetical protein
MHQSLSPKQLIAMMLITVTTGSLLIIDPNTLGLEIDLFGSLADSKTGFESLWPLMCCFTPVFVYMYLVLGEARFTSTELCASTRLDSLIRFPVGRVAYWTTNKSVWRACLESVNSKWSR